MTEAEALFRRALAGNEEHLGPRHAHTLSSCFNLAMLLEAEGQSRAAEASASKC